MTSAVSPEKSMAPVAEDLAFYHGDHVKVIRQHPGREHACDARAENHRMLTHLRHSVILEGSLVAA